MKSRLVVTGIVFTAMIALTAGFWLGFRQAWHLAPMAEATARGAVGLNFLPGIDAGRTDEVTYYFESQIDAGLMFWHDVRHSPVYPILKQLSGDETYAGYEQYVRRLAEYRKANPSPLWDPKDMAEVEAYLTVHKPEKAAEILTSSREAKAAMDAVVSEYAP